MWPFRRRLRERWPASAPLFFFDQHSPFTVGQSFEHCHLWGGTGSGKSTSSFRLFSHAACAAGYSAIFLCVKASDADVYLKRCRDAGREKDVVLFGPEHDAVYNPFDAELRRTDAGGRSTQSIVQLLLTLLEVGQRSSMQDSGDSAGYFNAMNETLVTNTTELLVQAKGEVDVPLLAAVVNSAPTSRQEASSEEWRARSFCWQCLCEADKKPKSPREENDLRLAVDFFMGVWADLAPRTRVSISSKFGSLVDSLQRGEIRRLISGRSTVTPESILSEGKIAIISTPPKLFGTSGVFLNVLWKVGFQQALERRKPGDDVIPALIATDEAHLVSVMGDQSFQSTARSSRTFVLNASQCANNYIAALGPHSEAAVSSLIGCHQTQIFHQQSDTKMNALASELLGQTKRYSVNLNGSTRSNSPSLFPGHNADQSSCGLSEGWEPVLQPSYFTRLKKGGPPDFVAEAVVYQGGRQFHATGGPWMPIRIPQQF